MFIQIQNNVSVTSGVAWICVGIMVGSIVGQIMFKYLVYRLQSATGYAAIAKQHSYN